MNSLVQCFIGIDPGLGGAIAALPVGQGEAPRFWDTPTIQIKVGKSLKSQMDPYRCMEILKDIDARHGPVHITLEKVTPMPSTHAHDFGTSMGATSAFNFGKGVGIWIGLMTALELPFEEVHPATWKKAMMPGMGKEKGASILKAVQLFPASGRDLYRKRDHGRSDALLMAEYGRRTLHLSEVERPPMHPKDLDEIMKLI